jgi:hypothetical protein
LRFLPSGQNSISPPDSLTERRFRTAWALAGRDKHAKDTEVERFGRVAAILESRP